MKLIQLLEEVLWPRGCLCLCCEERIDEGLLCQDCQRALDAVRLKEHQQGPVRSVYRYDGVAKELVIKLKMDGVEDAAAVLSNAMAEEILGMQLPQNAVLTWVTMPRRRLRERNIDHGRALCDAVSERCGLEVRQLLQRKGKFRTQRGLHREARLKNLNGTVVCTEKLDYPVLLIDDVTTTGATASVCVEALLRAGAPRVEVLTATRAAHVAQENDSRKAGRYGFHAY